MRDGSILIFGANGMLGFAVHRAFHDAGLSVLGVVRDMEVGRSSLCRDLQYVEFRDFARVEKIRDLLRNSNAHLVINAAGAKNSDGMVAQREMFIVNSVFPQLLARICAKSNAKLVHFSSDGVFSGSRGSYSENCVPDAEDYYGQTKMVGEPTIPDSLTIRCSMVGLSPFKADSLVDWVLGKTGNIQGYGRSIFNGLPVTEIATFLRTFVLPRVQALSGVLHLHAEPISKLNLLRHVIRTWGRDDLQVIPDDSQVLDRSLRSERLFDDFGYKAPEWGVMLTDMRRFYESLRSS